MFLAFYPALVYTLAACAQYVHHSATYDVVRDRLSNVIRNLVMNLYIVFPLTLMALCAYRRPLLWHGLCTELAQAIVSIIAGDVWFYTCHRACHTKHLYFLHRQHHEFPEPVGLVAFYGHPIDVVLINFGYDFVHHVVFGLSYFHWLLLFTIVIGNSVYNAHARDARSLHFVHHKLYRYNYGVNLFMDKLLGTENSTCMR